ncbi:hypothetical protein [Cellulomonas triticagri]|uniref:Uncharacterized protein n=1 Tax=Cellulomonas triticagri TaxID=2483352 RepID=A0A3M2JBQ4_9CELL|nr:hypothetical protein [Cellulomonas triticagri]RMI08953.1 hypothetical protein EBM89_12485 [Cellulomonas triticagri]
MAPTPADVATDAVAALTALAREPRGAPTAGGDPTEGCFAAALAQVLAVTAADVGGLGALLRGVTDHRSAGLVRRLVLKAVGGDESALPALRSVPVRVHLDPAALLGDAPDEPAVRARAEAYAAALLAAVRAEALRRGFVVPVVASTEADAVPDPHGVELLRAARRVVPLPAEAAGGAG